MADEVKTDDVVTTAKKRYNRARDAYSKQRQLADQDTRFVMGDSDNRWQWPDEIYDGRNSDQRVCLTVNLTAQHCNQIVNEIRRNRPAVKVSPADNYADKKTAELLGGLVRNIQAANSSDIAHDVASEHAVFGGEGYWRVITEYESENSFDQVLRIIPCMNPRLVYIDPDAREIDRSDANWGFVFEDVPTDEVKRDHPDLDPSSWTDDDKNVDWYNDETIRIAEYFYCEYSKDTAVMLSDGTNALKSEIDKLGALPEGITILKERPTEIKKWKWCKLVGGHDKPVDEREWLGKYLPIIMVVGKEVNVDGKIIRKGQVRDLKDTARMVNYAYSETVQTLALQNKIPYTGTVESIQGFEDQWKKANKSTDSILFWNARDDQGRDLPEPKRQMPAVMPAAQIELLRLSIEQMRGASGQQASNFGIRSEAQSGIGIQRLKVQGEVATFHFPDNLARALRYEATVLIDLIQKYYDSKRIVRILGLDGTEETAVLDPEQQAAYQEQQTDVAIQKVFNPNVGLYDVAIDVGPSFQTQRQEAAVALADMANHAKDPASAAVLTYLTVKSADFAGSDEAADMLQKTLPPQLQENKNQPQIPPQVAQQMQAMIQEMQGMEQAIGELQSKLQEAQAGAQTKIQEAQITAQVTATTAQIDAETEMQKAALDADIAIKKANIAAATKIREALIASDTKREITEIEGHFGLAEAEIAALSQENICAMNNEHAQTISEDSESGNTTEEKS